MDYRMLIRLNGTGMPYRPRHNSMIRAFLLGLLASLFFALLGGVVVYHDTPPDAAGFVGLGIVVLGLVMNSLSPARNARQA